MAKVNSTGTNPFKVGDILYYNAGYTMGIPCFVHVTRVTPKKVFGTLMKTRKVTDDGYGQNGTCVPIPGTIKMGWNGQPETVQGMVRDADNKEPWVSIEHHYASKWNGKPKDYYTD